MVLPAQGYLPTILDRRSAMLDRKRLEYHNFVEQYYQTRSQEFHKETYRQASRSWLDFTKCNSRD